MKSILNLAFVFAALFSVSTATAQKANPKISKPDQADVRISCTYNSNGTFTICVDYCRITGLGNATSVAATLTTSCTADVSCYNRGQEDKDPVKFMPGQASTAQGNTVYLTPDNGNLIIQNCAVSTTISGDCKNTNDTNGFSSVVRNVLTSDLWLTLNGSTVSLKDYINQLTCTQ